MSPLIDNRRHGTPVPDTESDDSAGDVAGEAVSTA